TGTRDEGRGEREKPRPGPLSSILFPRPFARVRWDDLAAPLLLGGVTAGLVLTVPRLLGEPPTDDPAAQLADRVVRAGLVYGLPAAAAFALAWRPVRFALALGALFAAGL